MSRDVWGVWVAEWACEGDELRKTMDLKHFSRTKLKQYQLRRFCCTTVCCTRSSQISTDCAWDEFGFSYEPKCLKRVNFGIVCCSSKHEYCGSIRVNRTPRANTNEIAVCWLHRLFWNHVTTWIGKLSWYSNRYVKKGEELQFWWHKMQIKFGLRFRILLAFFGRRNVGIVIFSSSYRCVCFAR